MSDDGLVRRAAAGDARAFAELVRRHQSWLRGFLLRLARGDAALADDLAQETFFAAWRKTAQFRGEGSFRGWLARIAYTRYLMEARRKKLEPLDERAAAMEPQQVLDPGMRFDLERSMARLSLGQRASLTLCHALGHSHDEAAEILGMPAATVKSHLQRGRGKLLAMLGGDAP